MYPSDMPTDDEENLQKLPEDNTPPAAPSAPGSTPDDSQTPLPVDDPQKDTNVQPEEAYDVGIDAATGATPPPESDVVAFHPPESEVEDESDPNNHV